ncbi:hypothetical protein [Novosphingobium sp. ST904]|uniref:hypothetical protein n=2 Tax=Novosphingobium sp. ST904 TaxID=1684385 RepID=UPI0006CCDDA4|nr:hypothetical protein [Novosphingobium sp. ST904]KPH63573.1 hypothetical protein ADT71_13135 [Novosphingobium sp. ST904]TCM32353.1 hypothetical protein EDF59_12448 [Novosphingobium sp. ST904]
MTQIPIRTFSPLLSPLRAVLCSRAHAIRVAGHMADEGLAVSVVATLDPLQPWRVIEHRGDVAPLSSPTTSPEVAGQKHAACA